MYDFDRESMTRQMKKNHLTPKELAVAMGVSQVAISKWGRNDNIMSMKNFFQLVAIFNCSPNGLCRKL